MVQRKIYVIENGVEMSYKEFVSKYFPEMYAEFMKDLKDLKVDPEDMEDELHSVLFEFLCDLQRFILIKKDKYDKKGNKQYIAEIQKKFGGLHIGFDFFVPIPHDLVDKDTVVVGTLKDIVKHSHQLNHGTTYSIPNDCNCCS